MKTNVKVSHRSRTGNYTVRAYGRGEGFCVVDIRINVCVSFPFATRELAWRALAWREAAEQKTSR